MKLLRLSITINFTKDEEDNISQLGDNDAPFCEQQYTHGSCYISLFTFKSFEQPKLPQILDIYSVVALFIVTEYTHSILLLNLCGSLKLCMCLDFCLECTTSQNHDDNTKNHWLKWHKIAILLQEAYLPDNKNHTIIF